MIKDKHSPLNTFPTFAGKIIISEAASFRAFADDPKPLFSVPHRTCSFLSFSRPMFMIESTPSFTALQLRSEVVYLACKSILMVKRGSRILFSFLLCTFFFNQQSWKRDCDTPVELCCDCWGFVLTVLPSSKTLVTKVIMSKYMVRYRGGVLPDGWKGLCEMSF